MKLRRAMPVSEFHTTMANHESLEEVLIRPKSIPGEAVARRLRMLPPAGGPISAATVFSSLRKSLHASAQRSYYDALVRQLTVCLGPQRWVLTSSGRSALSLVLMALRKCRPQCDEVVIPAYTSYSVPAAVVRAGLRVRLCDIEPQTLGIDPAALSRPLTDRTLCVVPHHLFGLPCRIREIGEVASASQVPLVEDAAQGLGIVCEGHHVGMFGQAAIFSISRGKNIPGAGGGLIGVHDDELAEACAAGLRDETGSVTAAMGMQGAVEALLMAWFIRPSWYWLPASLPFLGLGASSFDPTFPIAPMTRFQLALLTYLLPGAGKFRQDREERAMRLRQALKGTEAEMLWPRDGDQGAYLRVPILLPTRNLKESVLDALNRRGLGSTEGYPLPLSQVPALRGHLAEPGQNYPIAEDVSRRLITLPTHVWVTDRDIRDMTAVVVSCRI